MTLGNSSADRRRTHSAHGETRNGERRNAGRGLEQDAARPGCYSAGTRILEAAMRGELERDAAGDVVLIPGAGRTTPWVWHWAWNADWGAGERRSSPRVYIAGTRNLGTAMRGERRGTQSGPWLHHQPPRRGTCAATMSVRPVVAVRPEHVKAAVPLSVSSSYAAAKWEQPGRVVRSNRRVQRVRSRFRRSAVERESGATLLGLADAS